MEFYKLGEKASTFYDPTTGFQICGDEVIAIDRLPKSKKIAKAKAGGHIVPASEAEYKAAHPELKNELTPAKPLKNSKKNPEEEDTYPYNPDLLKLTADQLRERIAEEGFLDDDLEKFEGMTDIKAMIRLFEEINKEYS